MKLMDFIGGASVVCSIILIAIGCLTWALRRKCRKRLKSGYLSKSQIKMDTKLGEGHFCEVWKGSLQPSSGASSLTVGVKKLKIASGERETRQFLEEALILQKIHDTKNKKVDGHLRRNIVFLHGVCLDSRSKVLVLEFMDGGSLLHFLSSNTNRNALSDKDLLKFSIDISNACGYLEKLGIIHRDIAARNCLLNMSTMKKNEDIVVKLADFGLAKDEKDVYLTVDPDAPLPLAWVAPEGFEGTFSIKSDVWAYGVLLWEIFCYGATPYGLCSKPEETHMCPMKIMSYGEIQRHVCNAKKTLLQIEPLPCTAQFPDSITDIMAGCWQFQRNMRPSFQVIAGSLNDAKKTMDHHDGTTDHRATVPSGGTVPVQYARVSVEAMQADRPALSVIPADDQSGYDGRLQMLSNKRDPMQPTSLNDENIVWETIL